LLKDALIYLSGSPTARRFVRSAPGARSMARRFVAGDTIEDGIVATRALNKQNMKVTLDYLGESVNSREEAKHAADVYVQMIDRIAAEKLDANVSLKLTQMGQDIDTAFCARTLDVFSIEPKLPICSCDLIWKAAPIPRRRWIFFALCGAKDTATLAQ